MKKIILYIIPLILLTACNSKKGTISTVEAVEEVLPVEEDYQFENVTLNDSLFASIEKSPCFGQCPVYTMKIYNNGVVKYSGKNFVTRTGNYVMEISRDQMLAFINKANSIKYMEMDDTYDNPRVTDVPSATTSIVIDRKRKQVKRRFGYPKELIEYEKLFDDLLNSNKWIQIESKTDKKF